MKKASIVILLVIIIISAGFFYIGQGKKELVLATTTSTYDSGLLDHIIPIFEEEYGIKVKVISVGTGQALELGRNGDVDVLLVHAPDLEEEFVNEGHGTYRKNVMYNQFILIGPAADPASVEGLNLNTSLTQIYDSRSIFCSRGDNSGTHNKEIKLWAQAGYDYNGISGSDNSSWYKSLGQGMGDTLRTASELEAYTIADEATFHALNGGGALSILVSGDEGFFNQYGVIPVNGTMHPSANQEYGELFADWIISESTQRIIDEYTKDGNVLFTSNAGD